MPFDLSALMNDPQFQTGLGLLGTSSPQNRPLLEAYQLLAQAKQRELMAKQQAFENNLKLQQFGLQQEGMGLQQKEFGLKEQGMGLQQKEYGLKERGMGLQEQGFGLQQKEFGLKEQAQQPQINHINAQTELLKQQAALEQFKSQQSQRMQEQISQFLPKILQQAGLSGESATPGTQQPTAPGTQIPSAPSTFNLADQFVSNVEGGYTPNDGGKGPTNFGINQRANPDVNVKALTPEAAAQIRKTRYWDAIKGDTLPPAAALVAYDAAVNQGQGYAQQLLQKTGGDPTLMLYQRQQDYQQLAKNPMQQGNLPGWQNRLKQLSQQVKEVAAAPAQPSAPAQAAGGMEPYRALGMLGGAMELSGGDVKGLNTISQALKPQLANPGQVVLGPHGEQSMLPNNPLDIQKAQIELDKLALEKQKFAGEQVTRTLENTSKAQAIAKAQATDLGGVQGVLDNSKMLSDAASALRTNPGLPRITGALGVLPDVPGSPAANARADLNALGSKILISTITSLKSLSQNGSTGFGQLSNVEGEHLVNSVASLKTSQNATQMKERLAQVIKNSNDVMDRAVSVYENTHGQSVYGDLPVGTRPLRDPSTGEQKLSKNGNPLLKLPNGKLVEEVK